MDQRIYVNTVLPVTSNRNVGVVAITTPADDVNWFSAMTDARDPDTGQLIFKTYFLGGACSHCRAIGKPQDCKHKDVPPWKDERSMTKMKAVMNTESYNREISGVVTVDSKLIYAQYVPAFVDKTRTKHKFDIQPSFIWVAPWPAA